jgi:hypothetical protein
MINYAPIVVIMCCLHAAVALPQCGRAAGYALPMNMSSQFLHSYTLDK